MGITYSNNSNSHSHIFLLHDAVHAPRFWRFLIFSGSHGIFYRFSSSSGYDIAAWWQEQTRRKGGQKDLCWCLWFDTVIPVSSAHHRVAFHIIEAWWFVVERRSSLAFTKRDVDHSPVVFQDSDLQFWSLVISLFALFPIESIRERELVVVQKAASRFDWTVWRS